MAQHLYCNVHVLMLRTIFGKLVQVWQFCSRQCLVSDVTTYPEYQLPIGYASSSWFGERCLNKNQLFNLISWPVFDSIKITFVYLKPLSTVAFCIFNTIKISASFDSVGYKSTRLAHIDVVLNQSCSSCSWNKVHRLNYWKTHSSFKNANNSI